MDRLLTTPTDNYLYSYSPVPWSSIFPGTGMSTLVHVNRPRENPSMREISNTEGYLRGKIRGNLRECSTHAVQSNTLLVYASAQKNSAMELRELQTQGRGRVYSSPYPGKYSAIELGCYTQDCTVKLAVHGLG